MIVYNSFNGRYSDNPRAIHQALVARGVAEEHVWLAAPHYRDTFPADVATVPICSPEAVAALEAADLHVSNCHSTLDAWLKHPPQVYLQTWHGTPLKRIHRGAVWQPGAAEMAAMDADVRRWDCLITPSPAGTTLLRSAFRFRGTVLETGYPRNDVLAGPGREARRARVREQFGIADGMTAVLYAPTYRDDEVWDDRPLGLDPAALLAELGEDHVLLLRQHYFLYHRRPVGGDERIRDLSAYPEVSDLLLAADVLVTDYSSVVFDFAITGKPILLYVYDLDHYRDRLRGFTLDLAELPGPLLADQGQLTAALRDLPGVQAAYAGRYAAFRERFCPLDDGQATERVIAALWPDLVPV